MINKLKEFRKKCGYTQEALAYMASVSRNTICSLERNEYKPGIFLCLKLNYIFGTEIYKLDYEEIDEVNIRREILHNHKEFHCY